MHISLQSRMTKLAFCSKSATFAQLVLYIKTSLPAVRHSMHICVASVLTASVCGVVFPCHRLAQSAV